MTEKSLIVDHLGERSILVPKLVQAGLRANDRAKVRMAVLQSAGRHAAEPARPADDIRAEARLAGLDGESLAQLVREANAPRPGLVQSPGLSDLATALTDDVDHMVVAAEAGGDEAAAALRARFESQRLALDHDQIEAQQVAAITSAGIGADSLHRLVMDLHKCLNRLAVTFAEEVVDGAHAYGLQPGDREPVKAFMSGLEATRRLKFDHPGLETSATRDGDRLVIQNDIGTTDAHVILVVVEEGSITLTYTDVHRGRAKFFVGLFEDFAVEWSGLARDRADGLAEEEAFFLVTGRFNSAGAKDRNAFLTEIGASLVFLIDWNKARKALRSFVDKADATRLLGWAARKRIGQRGFLQMGGTDLINRAVRRVAAGRIDYGTRLDSAIGRDGAIAFLRAVMRLCREGLEAGRSVRLVEDEIDAEIARHLRSAEVDMFAGIVRQAGLARVIAAGLANAADDGLKGRGGSTEKLVLAARRIEEKADRLAVGLRHDAARYRVQPAILQAVDLMEQSIDELEEAAFLLSLAPRSPPSTAIAPLAELCLSATRGAENVARAADAAALTPEGNQIDINDALEALAALGDIEHAADTLERRTVAAALEGKTEPLAALALIDCARRVERSTDLFARTANLLRGHVLGAL
jgi:hypothetical protein